MPRLASALVLFLWACQSPAGPTATADLVVKRVGEQLVITTTSTEPFYYFAVDESVAARISWVPCRQPTGCASVQRTSPARIALADIGQDPRSVVFFYYRLVSQGDSFAPDSIRSTVIRLGGT